MSLWKLINGRWGKNIGSGQKVGGDVSRDKELVLKRNTKYWFTATATGSTGWINYGLNFYEHEDKH